MNTARKGRRNEYKSIKLLEALGYYCQRSAASKGLFDIVAISLTEVLLVQCKSNRWPSALELEQMKALAVPDNARKLVHLWKDRCNLPVIKEL
jgi:Holliday junction resolvase